MYGDYGEESEGRRREEGFGGRMGRGGFGRGRPDIPKPVSVGEKLQVTIEAVGSQGDGIAKKEGFVIFVKGGKQGETVTVEIKEVRRSSAVAEIVQSEPTQ